MRKVLMIGVLTSVFPFYIGNASVKPIKIELSPYIESIINDSDELKLFKAISLIESSNNEKALNVKENAVGIIQIRPIMIKEVNRLVGYEKYNLEDRWDREKSFNIFCDYQRSVNPKLNFEIGSRKWNGGIQGHLKQSTYIYWQKISEILKS